MLGLVDFFHRLNTVKDQKEVKEKKIFKLPGVLTVGSVVVIFLVLLFSINVKQIKANSHTYDAFVAQQTGNLVAFLDGYKNSIEVAINPIDPIFLLAQNSPDVVIKNLDKLDREKIKEIFNQAVEYAEEGKKLDPKNVYNHYILAKLYNGFAELTKESQYLYKALETLEEGKKLSPNRIRLCWVEAQTYIIAGEYDQAIRALDQSIAIIDSPSEPYWFKSIVYFEQKKDDLAYEAAEQAINRGYRFHSIDDLKKLIPYFEEKENDEILIKLYTNLSSKEPKNTTYYEKLVAIYDKQGEYQKAMDILKKAAENIPAYSDRAWELYSALEQKL